MNRDTQRKAERLQSGIAAVRLAQGFAGGFAVWYCLQADIGGATVALICALILQAFMPHWDEALDDELRKLNEAPTSNAGPRKSHLP